MADEEERKLELRKMETARIANLFEGLSFEANNRGPIEQEGSSLGPLFEYPITGEEKNPVYRGKIQLSPDADVSGHFKSGQHGQPNTWGAAVSLRKRF